MSTGLTMPPLSGWDLNGRRRRLPGDLPADPTLVLIGFQIADQVPIDAWLAALPGVPAVELPVAPRPMLVARASIEGGMRRGIADHAVRARTWCVYGSVDGVLRSLAVAHRDVIAAVVSRDGGVVHREVGWPTAAGVAAVADALAGVHRPARSQEGDVPGRR